VLAGVFVDSDSCAVVDTVSAQLLRIKRLEMVMNEISILMSDVIIVVGELWCQFEEVIIKGIRMNVQL